MLIAKADMIEMIANLPDQISLYDVLGLFDDLQTKPAKLPLSCFELAKQHNLVGTLEDAPSDLSHNPIYMQGYGK